VAWRPRRSGARRRCGTSCTSRRVTPSWEALAPRRFRRRLWTVKWRRPERCFSLPSRPDHHQDS